MKINERFGQLASPEAIETTMKALAANGITAFVVEDGPAAKQKMLELLPAGAEVMNMTSMTLEGIDVVEEVLESNRYEPVRTKLTSMDDATQLREKRQLGAAPKVGGGKCACGDTNRTGAYCLKHW